MDGTVWVMFVLTEGALTLAPAHAVLFVVSQGLRVRSSQALWPAAGILTVNAFYFAIRGPAVLKSADHGRSRDATARSLRSWRPLIVE